METFLTKKNVEKIVYWQEELALPTLKLEYYYMYYSIKLRTDPDWPEKTRMSLEKFNWIFERKCPIKVNPEFEMAEEMVNDLKDFLAMSDEEIEALTEYELAVYEDSYLTMLNQTNASIRSLKLAKRHYDVDMLQLEHSRLKKINPDQQTLQKFIDEVDAENTTFQEPDYSDDFNANFKNRLKAADREAEE